MAVRQPTELQRIIAVFSDSTQRKMIPPKEWAVISGQIRNLKLKGFTEEQIKYAIEYTARTVPSFVRFGLVFYKIDEAMRHMEQEAPPPKMASLDSVIPSLLDDIGVANAAPAPSTQQIKKTEWNKPKWMQTDLDNLEV